jgi:hypothetical protein
MVPLPATQNSSNVQITPNYTDTQWAVPWITLSNTGPDKAYYATGDSTVMATTGSTPIPAGTTQIVPVGADLYLAAICDPDTDDTVHTATLNLGYDALRWVGGSLQILGGYLGSITDQDNDAPQFGLDLVGANQLSRDLIDISNVDISGNLEDFPLYDGTTGGVSGATAILRSLLINPTLSTYSKLPDAPYNQVAITVPGGTGLLIAAGNFPIANTKSRIVIWRAGPLSSITDVLASASSIITNLPGVMIGYRFSVLFVNLSAHLQKIAAGSGITLDATAHGLTGDIEIQGGMSQEVVFQIMATDTPAITVYGNA